MRLRKRMLSDKKMKEICGPFYAVAEKYIEDNILYQYAAFWFATQYEMNAMWEYPLEVHKTDIVNSLCDIDRFKFDLHKLDKELNEKYSLIIVSVNPFKLKKIPHRRKQ